MKSFDEYYQELFGQRWPGLKDALLAPGKSIPFDAGNGKDYYLDSASVWAAESLSLPDEGEILDACAAPGGKSLVIASRMSAASALLANELSSERRRRLSLVLDEHLPEDLRGRVKVSGFDAAAAGRRKSEHGRFAAILLDAPCSSERHVLASARALSEWSPARIRQLAQRQWSLLSAAFLLLAPGGCLVYSTCALSPAENDGPIERLFRKYQGQVSLKAPELLPGQEKTGYGVLNLPDRMAGAGPIFLARLRKH